MTAVEAWSLILGVITPTLVAIVNNPQWSGQKKRLVALAIAAVTGIVNVYVNNAFTGWELSAEGVLVNLALVIGASQAAYSTVWKPTGASDKIEEATSSK